MTEIGILVKITREHLSQGDRNNKIPVEEWIFSPSLERDIPDELSRTPDPRLSQRAATLPAPARTFSRPSPNYPPRVNFLHPGGRIRACRRDIKECLPTTTPPPTEPWREEPQTSVRWGSLFLSFPVLPGEVEPRIGEDETMELSRWDPARRRRSCCNLTTCPSCPVDWRVYVVPDTFGAGAVRGPFTVVDGLRNRPLRSSPRPHHLLVLGSDRRMGLLWLGR